MRHMNDEHWRKIRNQHEDKARMEVGDKKEETKLGKDGKLTIKRGINGEGSLATNMSLNLIIKIEKERNNLLRSSVVVKLPPVAACFCENHCCEIY